MAPHQTARSLQTKQMAELFRKASNWQCAMLRARGYNWSRCRWCWEGSSWGEDSPGLCHGGGFHWRGRLGSGKIRNEGHGTQGANYARSVADWQRWATTIDAEMRGVEATKEALAALKATGLAEILYAPGARSRHFTCDWKFLCNGQGNAVFNRLLKVYVFGQYSAPFVHFRVPTWFPTRRWSQIGCNRNSTGNRKMTVFMKIGLGHSYSQNGPFSTSYYSFGSIRTSLPYINVIVHLGSDFSCL